MLHEISMTFRGHLLNEAYVLEHFQNSDEMYGNVHVFYFQEISKHAIF